MVLFYSSATVWLLSVSPGAKICGASFGHDFLPFYTAGSLVRDGRMEDLYDLQAVRSFEHATASTAGLSLGDAAGPWWNPPFYAWVFVPLAGLSYQMALGVWTALNLLFAAIAIVLLRRMFQPKGIESEWRAWGLVPLLIFISTPFLLAFTHAQNSFMSLLLLTVTVSLWREGRGLAAGLALGLLLYKPQLAAVIGVILVLDLGWRAALGLAVTATALLVVTTLTLPGQLADYLHRLPQNLHFMQIEHPYLWERHITLKAFWRLLLQGRAAGPTLLTTNVITWLSIALLAIPLLITALRLRGTFSAERRDRLVAAAIVIMPLLMPFYFDYDLLLLAIPAVLIARDSLLDRRTTLRGMVPLWVFLNLWMLVNPNVAVVTGVNLAVLALCGLGAMLLIHSRQTSAAVRPIEQEKLPLAAAA